MSWIGQERSQPYVEGLLSLALVGILAGLCPAKLDSSRYMGISEIQPGMKGIGRTVMSGTRIETFDFEVISVLHNAYYPKQSIILVRCSGLNLEHSGIIGGMSGSPCYVVDDAGRERMIGAVAYGWSFNKDPTCGLQPIEQMLEVQEFRDPSRREWGIPATQTAPAGGSQTSASKGSGMSFGQLIARGWKQPIPAASRFSVFNEEIPSEPPGRTDSSDGTDQLRPLQLPVMVAGGSERTCALLKGYFSNFDLLPVASGSTAGAGTAGGDVTLEPGSALCVALMMGDLQIVGFGTCTEVMGDKVLGFGHPMGGTGWTRLPMATGEVHTTVSSVMRSNKIGSALDIVGTLWGDESTAIFGINNSKPPTVPMEVVVNDIRGTETYQYTVAVDEFMTAQLLAVGAMESFYAPSLPPREHTVTYSIRTNFEGLGTFESSDFTSQSGEYAMASDVMFPTMMLMDAPFGKTVPTRCRVEVSVREGTSIGRFDQVTLNREVYKPGEKIDVRVRWYHLYKTPNYTEKTYSLQLPDDIPDGEYPLMVGSSTMYLSALRTEKPYLFRADTLEELLEQLNMLGSIRSNRVYLHLQTNTGGVSVDRLPLPELPSYRVKILADSGRSDLELFNDSIVEQYQTDFVVQGGRGLKIKVDRRADQ